MRRYITYPHVASSLALFIALGGSAYAVTQIDPNSVGTKQLKPNAVKSGKIADRTIKRVDAKQGAFATPPQLAGKLGVNATAANAAKLGGIGPGGFVKGNGTQFSGAFDDEETTVLSLPAGGVVNIPCSASGHGILFRTTGSDYDVFQYSYVDNATSPNVLHYVRESDDGPQFIVPTAEEAHHEFEAKAATGQAVSLTVFVRFVDATDRCVGRYRGTTFPNG